MINPVAAPSASDAFTDAPASPAEPPPERAPRPEVPPKAEAEPDIRLTIDPAEDGPYFVYTLQDRATGRIIAQLPRHEVTALGGRPDYHAGDLIRTKA